MINVTLCLLWLCYEFSKYIFGYLEIPDNYEERTRSIPINLLVINDRWQRWLKVYMCYAFLRDVFGYLETPDDYIIPNNSNAH